MKIKENEIRIGGRICEIQREVYTVITEIGELRTRVKGIFYKGHCEFPVIGDYVLIKYNPHGTSMIEEVSERRNIFVRPDLSGHGANYVKTVKEQILAVNFDYVFIVASLNKDFNLNRIARYITVTLQNGAKPVVILTKADLCSDTDDYLEEVKSISDQIGVHAISAVTGNGMEKLNCYLKKGVTIVLLGSSGVGKSTLLNTIAGKEIMKVSEIRERDSKGRHTTTHRQLITLPSGVTLMDTPGIREIGMCDVNTGIEDTFSDIVELICKCKFTNCTHQTEPGCAVRQAISNKELSLERWELYCHLQDENHWHLSKLIRKNKKERY